MTEDLQRQIDAAYARAVQLPQWLTGLEKQMKDPQLEAEMDCLRASHARLLERINERIGIQLNNQLCEMEQGYDDAITGFNEAWDIVRNIFEEEMDSVRGGRGRRGMTTQRQIEAVLDVALLRGAQFDEQDVRLILDAAEAAAWQPIETAPKDGTVVDLAWIGMPDVRPGFWNADRRSNSPRPFWDWWSEFGNAMMRANPPTHWHPLPAPPRAEISCSPR